MKRLGQVSICGIPYDVEEHSAQEDHELLSAYGYTIHARRLIVVQAGLEAEIFRNVVLHEVQHGVWEHSGVRSLSSDMAGYEEAFIQIYTPHLIAALKSMAKLRVR